MIRFDGVSVFLVGLIGTACILLAALSTTGLLQELREAAHTVETSVPYPEVRQAIPGDVTRIVVDNAVPLWIERVDEPYIRVFGTYRTTQADEANAAWRGRAVTTRQSGHTLFVSIQEPPVTRGIAEVYPSTDTTLTVPEGVAVDVRGQERQSSAHLPIAPRPTSR